MSKPQRAVDAGLALCHDCHHLNRWPAASSNRDHCHCHFCGGRLHLRQPDSLAYCWALVLTSLVLLIPANTLPIMTVNYLGRGEPDTIASGVMHLAQSGMLGIALLVFVASIAVPVLKLAGMIFLLLRVQRHTRLSPDQCTRLYRFIELIGRWSMLDLFMISILVTLVDLGAVASINAGPGATAFAAVVVLTMLAATHFDTRLIWDLEQDND